MSYVDEFRRDGPPGIAVHAPPIDARDARQIVRIRSRSAGWRRARGWEPIVFVTLDHVAWRDRASEERVELRLDGGDVDALVAHLTETLAAARADVAYGAREA